MHTHRYVLHARARARVYIYIYIYIYAGSPRDGTKETADKERSNTGISSTDVLEYRGKREPTTTMCVRKLNVSRVKELIHDPDSR
jgi:hypothetical protein